jgi:hypothetical protein
MRAIRSVLFGLALLAGVGCGGDSDPMCQPHCIDSTHLETCHTFTDLHGNQTSVVHCTELMQNGINLVCQAATASCELP